MKSVVFEKKFIAAMLLGTLFLAACGDDDSDFAPVSKNRGYDYAFRSTGDFKEYPCNEMREGREAIVGRDKDSYVCKFDYRDSVYIWAGDTDTLTAEGREFKRAESSSSEKDGDESSSSRSSSSYSSSRNSSSSSSYKAFNPDTDYGTMTDSRDGKTYKTVVVNGLTWMAENLNYAGNKIGTSVCYGDYDDNCEIYGRLYSRDAAMNSSSCAYGSLCDLGNDPIQGICPNGWHIPTKDEVEDMLDNVTSSRMLRAAGSTWNYSGGTDNLGLSFLGAGNWDEEDGFEDLHSYEVMWVYEPDIAQYYLLIAGVSDNVTVWALSSAEFYCTIRCIKDGSIVPASSSSISSSSSSYSSSSSAKSSSSVSSSSVSSSSRTKQAGAEPLLEAAGEQFNPDIEYGTMTDPRDGKTYKTVKVGSATWMAENLNYAGNEIGVSTCFNDDDRFCELYGHFYSRSAAMNSSSCAYKSSCDLGTGHIQGICPDGWHIPTNKEAQDLVNLASGHALPLMSAKGWKTGITPGTDTYGLSFVGAGSYCSDYGFHSLGEYGRLWVYYASSTQYYIVIRGLENEAEVWDYNDEECYNPVRCVKDE